MERIERSIKRVGLDAICSCYAVLNLSCAVGRRRFAHFGLRGGFSAILKGKTDIYEKSAARHLTSLFAALALRPLIRFQRGSAVCEGIYGRLGFSGGSAAQLVLLERGFDAAGMLALPRSFAGLLGDLLRDLPPGPAEVRYDKAGERDAVDSVELDGVLAGSIGHFGALEGMNAVYGAFTDFKRLRAGEEVFGALRVPKLRPAEELQLQGRAARVSDQLYGLFMCAKFVENRWPVF